MRHRVKGKKLDRDKKARKALFKNLITSLILYERIKTTEAKAKAVRGLVDSLMVKAKSGTLQARRMLAAFLVDPKAVDKMMDVLAKRFGQRKTGFSRIIRLQRRRGDNAQMVQMELIKEHVEEQKPEEPPKKEAKGKTYKRGKEGLWEEMKIVTTKQTDIKREWHLIDAKDQVLGRLATNVATLLMGKKKSYYVPY